MKPSCGPDAAWWRQLAATFALPGQVEDAVSILEGHIHQTWRLRLTDGSKWAAQQLNTRVFPAPLHLVENGSHIARALERIDQPPRWTVPVPRTTAAGQLLAQDSQSAWWRVCPWLAGRPIPAATGADTYFAAAAAFGEFAARLRSLQEPLLPVLPHLHDLPEHLETLRRVVRADTHARKGSARALLARVETDAPRLCELWSGLRRVLPHQTVAHRDAKLGNLLIEGDDQVTAILDIDTAMPDSPLWDVGDLLRSGAATGAEDEIGADATEARAAMVEAIADGWLSGAAVGSAVVSRRKTVQAGAVVAFEQGVRFLADHLDGDRYYPVRFAEQNRRRAESQLNRSLSLERCSESF